MMTTGTDDWRRNVVHGWAFRDHSPEEVEAIRTFLHTGKREDLPEQYHRMFDVVVREQTENAHD